MFDTDNRNYGFIEIAVDTTTIKRNDTMKRQIHMKRKIEIT